jgi:3-methyladenine DNA glycosylase AlkC
LSSATPQPFKDRLDAAAVARLASMLVAANPAWQAAPFIRAATDGLDKLELKARVRHVAQALVDHLAPDFPTALAHVLAALPTPDTRRDDASGGGFAFELWPLTDFVAMSGLEHPTLALEGLRRLTVHFSCEFAIRPYLERHPELCRQTLHVWLADPDPLVRRLISEGTRPRLPWGARIPTFSADPSWTLELLTALRDDPADTVRLSVANHLNDLSKDQPDLVRQVARAWLPGAPPTRRLLVRHALRTLIKAGDEESLELLGHAAPAVQVRRFTLLTPTVQLGSAVAFELEVEAQGDTDQDLVFDLVLHLRGARGQLRPKVIKWTRRQLEAGETVKMARRQPIRPVTVRSYYPGTHRIEVQINGAVVAGADFELVVE